MISCEPSESEKNLIDFFLNVFIVARFWQHIKILNPKCWLKRNSSGVVDTLTKSNIFTIDPTWPSQNQKGG